MYVDEAGNSGGVQTARRHKSTGEDVLNFLDQPLFVNGAVVTLDPEDESQLLERYQSVKQRFPKLLNNGELKGTDLSARRCNDALRAIVEEVLDSTHFYANVYDKRFYLSTLILSQLSSLLYAWKNLFYSMASALSGEPDDFFVRYCLLVQNPTKEAISDYLDYLSCYSYRGPIAKTVFPEFLSTFLNTKDVELREDILLSKDAYVRPVAANLVNLNSLSELVMFVKEEENVHNEELEVVHDKILGIDEVMRQELENCGVRVTFEDSSRHELLQLADNVASLLCHYMNRTMGHLRDESAWREESTWDNAVLSRVMRAIGYSNIKLTVPLCDIGVYQGISELYEQQNRFGVVEPLPSALDLQFGLNLYVEQARSWQLDRLTAMNGNLLDELNELKR